MTDIFLRILLVLFFCLIHGGIYLLVRREKPIGMALAHGAAFTFQTWLWTVLGWLLGLAGILVLPALVLVGCPLAVISVVVIIRSIRERPISPWSVLKARFRTISPVAYPFAVLACLSALFWMHHGWHSIPLDYDGLSYHLGTAIHMYQDGDFRLYEGESGYTNYFARGVELLGVVFLNLFGHIRVLNIVQWVVIPPVCLLMYVAARAVGVGRTGGIIAASWVFSVPVVVHQTSMTYTDLSSLGWIVVAACSILSGSRLGLPGTTRMLLLFAACGLAVAAKFNAAPATFLIGLVAVFLWGWRAFFTPSRQALGVVLVGILMAALAGLFWPTRNWIVAGSPIHPFSLELGPVTIAHAPLPMEATRLMPETPPEGYTPEEWLAISLTPKLLMSWTWLDWESWRRYGPLGTTLREASFTDLDDISHGYRGDNKLGGLGAGWLLSLFPLSLVYMALQLFQLRDFQRFTRRRRRLLFARLAIPVLCWGIFMVTIAAWWARFSLFLPLFSVLMAVVLLKELGRIHKTLPVLVYLLLLFTFTKDMATGVLFNRDREIQRRFLEEAPSHRPVDYFLWRHPDAMPHRMIAEMLDMAAPGETIAYHTPYDPVFTGLFADAQATVRLFPLPTVFPPPDDFTNEELWGFLDRERVAFILLGPTSGEDFEQGVISLGGRLHTQRDGWRLYEFPEWREAHHGR
ncbi:MAG: hypothetical protein JJU11_12505 [Candidatus Sumerlaeia bacterium]|nr:hypothetical protein [Candidatus Sumerlaeia bacterium]